MVRVFMISSFVCHFVFGSDGKRHRGLLGAERSADFSVLEGVAALR